VDVAGIEPKSVVEPSLPTKNVANTELKRNTWSGPQVKDSFHHHY